MCYRDFAVPSLYGIICNQNNDELKTVFPEANEEKKPRRSSMEHYERSRQWLRG